MAKATVTGLFVHCFKEAGEFEGKPYENYKITIFDEEGFSNDKFLTLKVRLDNAKRLHLNQPETLKSFIGKAITVSGNMSTRDGKFQFDVQDLKM